MQCTDVNPQRSQSSLTCIWIFTKVVTGTLVFSFFHQNGDQDFVFSKDMKWKICTQIPNSFSLYHNPWIVNRFYIFLLTGCPVQWRNVGRLWAWSPLGWQTFSAPCKPLWPLSRALVTHILTGDLFFARHFFGASSKLLAPL